MENLNEELGRIKKMMGVINETTQIINEDPIKLEKVSSGKRCWYYKSVGDQKFYTDKRVPNPYDGAGGVQDFLIALGWDISKDWKFGNNTAKALAFWLYNGKSGIDTVNKLWSRLKEDGYDVGETTGYGPKMKSAVALLIVNTCKKIGKTCKVDEQTLFDMNFKLLPEEDIEAKKVLIPKKLNDSFKYAVNYWRTYLKTPAVQKKIISNMSVMDYISSLGSNVIEKYLTALDKIEKTGWKDYTQEAESIGANMYVNGSCPEYAVCVNLDTYFNMYKNNGMRKVAVKTEDTFVHEIQHILWRKVQKLNSEVTIQQAFPSAFDYYGSIEGGGNVEGVKNLSQTETIPADTKKELEGKGIDFNKLKAYFSDKEWTDGYYCDWNEKLSNLAGYRSYLTDGGYIKLGEDITLEVMSAHIKGLLNNNIVSTDFERMIACWVLGGMNPKLSVFIKELNDLAQKEIKPNGDDLTQIDNNLV